MKRNKKEDILLNTDNDDISMLAEIQTDPDEVTAMEFNKEIPVMPLRNMVMFPSVVMPVTIGRPSTLKLINAAYKKKLPIAVVCQIQAKQTAMSSNTVYFDLFFVKQNVITDFQYANRSIQVCAYEVRQVKFIVG